MNSKLDLILEDDDSLLFSDKKLLLPSQDPLIPPPQTLLILPHHIKSIWFESEPCLQRLSQGKIANLLDFMELLNFLINLHYFQKKKTKNLRVLLRFFEEFSEEELNYFLKRFLPFIGKVALNIKELFPNSIRIFKQNKENTQEFSKKQILCLLSHMFLCTFHQQNNEKLSKTCNFSHLYHEEENSRISLKITKIQCFYNYFKRFEKFEKFEKFPLTSPMNSSIIFQRLLSLNISLFSIDFWLQSQKLLSPIIFHKEKLIENSSPEKFMQIVFANKEIGGGVLNEGGLQEELRICASPEMLPAILMFESLEDYEAILYLGCEKFNEITGYGDKAKFSGNFTDKTPLDIFEKRDICLLGIDAINFRGFADKKTQFHLNMILRELNKAFIGFKGSDIMKDKPKKAIATGKWGCGDFLGDFQLKLIIQWLAASQNEREIEFFFREKESIEKFERVCGVLKKYKVGEIVGYLKEFAKTVVEENVDIGFFEFMKDFVE